MALTEMKIKSANPVPGKVVRLSDSEGLFLEIKGNSKSWVLRYFFGGKERRIGLGAYPEVSLKEARIARDECRALIRKGIDPLEERNRRKADLRGELTFETIAREYHRKFSGTWVPAHASRLLGRLEHHVFPYLGRKNIADITAMDVLAVARRLETQGKIESAHRIVGIMGQVFRYAVSIGRAERDPTRDIKGAIPPVKVKHFPAITDPKRLGEVLRMLDAYEGTPAVTAALKLAPLLAVRPGELRHMRWEQVDFHEAEWRFTLSKTGQPHIVPLARQVRKILAGLKQIAWDSPWCFPSDRSRERPISDMALTAALRRLGLPREEVSVHGFRATFRTLADEVLGFRPDVIEHQLGHRVRDPLGRAYNRTKHLDERRRLMQAWADCLERLKQAAAAVSLK